MPETLDLVKVIEPVNNQLMLSNWISEHWHTIRNEISENGVFLFRGFDFHEQELSRVLDECCEARIGYEYRSTPRVEAGSNIYTSTEYPADRHILQHNENSYTNKLPTFLWFHCVTMEFQGGETPLTDSQLVYEKLPNDLIERFRKKGLRYERHYNPFIDLPWQEVFNTDDKSVVERYCSENEIEYVWQEGNLSTAQYGTAVSKDPASGNNIWFNQAHLFHPSSHGKNYLDLLSSCGISKPPRNVLFADGSEISESDIMTINKVYSDNTVSFKWQKGDILLVNNNLVAHGRMPYEGERRVLVAMT